MMNDDVPTSNIFQYFKIHIYDKFIEKTVSLSWTLVLPSFKSIRKKNLFLQQNFFVVV
jgi:hypothetical protein